MLAVAVAVLTAVQELVVLVVGARAGYLSHVLQRKALMDWAAVVVVVLVRIPLQ
jgi:hypothetical protein